MIRNFILATVAMAFAIAVSVLPSQELPKTSNQPREAQQPTTSDTAPLPARREPARKPQLTDPPTDEENRPVTDREVNPDDAPPKTQTSTATVRRRNPDLVMATWNALTRHQEIALAEIASRRANSTEVRLYAKLMMDEHQAFLERLQPFTPDANMPDFLKTKTKDARLIDDGTGDEASRPAPDVRDSTSPDVLPPDPNSEIPARGNRRRPGQRVAPRVGETSGRTTPERPGADAETGTDSSASAGREAVEGAEQAADSTTGSRRGGDQPGERDAPIIRSGVKAATPSSAQRRNFNVIQLERELAVQSLASSKMLLNELSGPEFDLWFLAQQVAIHKCMRDQMIVYQRHVSPDLARVFAQGERAADDHLAKAQQLLKAFTDHAVAADGRRPVSIRAVSRQKTVKSRASKE